MNMKGQNRQHYRLYCSLPIAIMHPNATEPIEGQMINFSESGLSFASALKFDYDDIVALSFDIGTKETTAGVVRRCVYLEESVKFKYSTSVEFVPHADPIKAKSQRERFYKFIVRMQIERQRLEKLEMEEREAQFEENKQKAEKQKERQRLKEKRLERQQLEKERMERLRTKRH
jgi:hypothetical protein